MAQHKQYRSQQVGWGGITVVRPVQRPRLRHIQQGSVAFYERIRPVFEATYNELRLAWRQALDLDRFLWFSVMKHGPNEHAIEIVLDGAERTGVIGVTESLEALYDTGPDSVEDDDVADPDVGSYEDELEVSPDEPPRFVVKRCLPMRRHIVGPIIDLECDWCGRQAIYVYDFVQETLCGTDAVLHYRIRYTKWVAKGGKGVGPRPVWALERRYW